MKPESEAEKSQKRIALLESQNLRFKKLLESALEVTKKPTSKSKLNTDENEFWQEAIRVIENEKTKLQEDMNLLSSTEDDLSVTVKKLESDNLELRKKLEILLDQLKVQEKEMTRLKIEHNEIKFLLSQPNVNTQWFKNILKLGEDLTQNSSSELLDERQKLQKKIMTLERNKNDLICAIEDITNPGKFSKKVSSANLKVDLEKALIKAIDEVAKREIEAQRLKVLDLEKERSDLLNELQAVLDNSRKEIAEEYCSLQLKIQEIEKEKAGLVVKTKRSLNLESTESDHQLNNILDAFSTYPKTTLCKTACRTNFQDEIKSEYDGQCKHTTPSCIIL